MTKRLIVEGRFRVVRRWFRQPLLICAACACLVRTEDAKDHVRWHAGAPLDVAGTGEEVEAVYVSVPE